MARHKQSSLLLLPPIPANLDVATLPKVYKSIAETAKKTCEPAGKAYHEYCKRSLGLEVQEESTKATRDRSQSQEEDAKRRKEWEERHKDDVTAAIEEEPEENLYEVLGLGHIGFNASQKQIKKAYQKMILKHHPDKKKGPKSEAEKNGETDPKWLAIQKAWDVLSNESKRRGYDSTFDFDDFIPTGNEELSPDNDDADFYELYGPVFERNGRFSVKKPVLLLGDHETDIAQVRKFYQFWSRFDSWREFSKYDEFKDGDIETAGCREEKRWMINQNEKIRKKKKKKEYERISNLVERAQKRDPRILRAREEEKQKKEKAAKERLAAKLAAEKELEEKRMAEEKEKAEAERIAKETREKEKKERQAKKKALKRRIKLINRRVETSCNWLNKSPSERLTALDMVDDICHGVQDADELSELFAALANVDAAKDEVNEKAAMKALEALNLAHQEKKQNKADKAKEQQSKREAVIRKEEELAAAKRDALKGEEWSQEELSTLAKALKKFPGGSRKRWENVAEYININCSQHEGKNRTKEQCLERVKELGKEMQAKRDSELVSSESAFEQSQRGVKARSSRKDALKASEQKQEEGKVESASETIWTDEEQKQLQLALKKYPASMEKNERWRKISAAVPTKTKKECVGRYKFIRAQILAKKK
mmetsp:Transcript_16595/g.21771  ORF Transcript_16595/g.21771 Transcript_16595/m.21771 type:complete len:655 (-) Transcript_16595:817-2781(-)